MLILVHIDGKILLQAFGLHFVEPSAKSLFDKILGTIPIVSYGRKTKLAAKYLNSSQFFMENALKNTVVNAFLVPYCSITLSINRVWPKYIASASKAGLSILVMGSKCVKSTSSA